MFIDSFRVRLVSTYTVTDEKIAALLRAAKIFLKKGGRGGKRSVFMMTFARCRYSGGESIIGAHKKTAASPRSEM